jgi:SP family general alpha glucoside:H+ symporter-like MFS transporter
MGSIAAGLIADRGGRKISFATSFLFSIVGITLEVVATSSPVFFAGKFINGFATGGFISTGFTYIGEVSTSLPIFESNLTKHQKQIAPTALRGVLSSAGAIAFTFGPFLVALIQKGQGAGTTRWAYRSIFISQYGVLAVGLVGWAFMPEYAEPFLIVVLTNIPKVSVVASQQG